MIDPNIIPNTSTQHRVLDEIARRGLSLVRRPDESLRLSGNGCTIVVTELCRLTLEHVRRASEGR
ncbi:hypothetical protein HLB44_25465 [Aquincola sp. S2]|uniref:Uncharacterized protein n=1 Tax=Pseudaquabacterium terrae TaxID=2732868 RepID=A0ABX2EP53_9BURK|nr:hypothetical protein [Aquabacterium terrae]NRF70363.1 hypothetical protein [Aquabacterium terrae]